MFAQTKVLVVLLSHLDRETTTGFLSRVYLIPIMLFAITIAGCASTSQSEMELAHQPQAQSLSPAQCAGNAALQATSDGNGQYLIQPGDELDISFYMSPEFDDNVIVRPDGNITMRFVGELPAAGRTPAQLAKEMDNAYRSELRNPQVAVRVKNTPSRQVFVEGEVTKAGPVPMQPGMTALQAIANVGGLTNDAGNTAVLIRRDACGTPQGMKLDLQSAMNTPDKGEDIALLPRDILVIPRSGIANLDLWIDQHIRKMIPVTPYLPLPL
ncbi:MAG: polysaccharide biosynthesis/export family protein [Candidatus Binataceae bacterium]|nr:polysaccharide biosynthesis/export family protein [Candidatus Binataceae bacterium]